MPCDGLVPEAFYPHILKPIEAGKRYKLSEPDFLTFSALEDGNRITFEDWDETTLYRIFSFEDSKGKWETDACYAEINKNERVQFKVADGKERGGLFGKMVYAFQAHTCSGSIMSLINQEMEEDAFSFAFAPCMGMRIAPKLPAIKLSARCYQGLFQGCENLTVAPGLPATELGKACYGDMFANCTSLQEAPELPATKLMNDCYADMFMGCTSLKEAPQLPAIELDEYCYLSMFMDCSALESAPELPAAVMKTGSYSGMFSGCSALVNAPELPASELALECYDAMFYGCSSLTTAPTLNASTLASRCYRGLFGGCEKINHITMLATSGFDSEDCLNGILEYGAATGTILVKDADVKATIESMENVIPAGWAVNIAQ